MTRCDSDSILLFVVPMGDGDVVVMPAISKEMLVVSTAREPNLLTVWLGLAAVEIFITGANIVVRSVFDITCSLIRDRRHFCPTRVSQKYIPVSDCCSLQMVMEALPHAYDILVLFLSNIQTEGY